MKLEGELNGQGNRPENLRQRANPMEQIVSLDRKGSKHSAFINWFNLTSEQRKSILIKNLRLASKRTVESYLPHAKNAEDCPPEEKFVLTNFSILSSTATEKLFVPVGEITISDRDENEITDDEGSLAWQRFNQFVRENKIKLEADMDDFYSPASTLKRFSVEEMRAFLLNLSDHISSGSQLFDWNKIVHPIKHTDLLTDTRLSAYIKRSVLPEWPRTEMLLANYLSQDVFPSPEFFEELYRRMQKECDPHANYKISSKEIEEETVPSSLYYFTFLRRINQISKRQIEDSPQKVEERKRKIVSYLLNDEFIRRALTYLKVDEVYDDEFLAQDVGLLIYNTNIEIIGDEAKEIKRQRFSEVLKTAISFLEEKRDYDTIQRLKEREVEGVKFAEFLS